MAEKHIFIGLGGSGVNTVSLIKYKVYERTKAAEMKSRLQIMNENYRFMFVDTDGRDVARANERYRTLYEEGKTEFISRNELLNLGDMNPYIIYQEALEHPEITSNRRIKESCPNDVARSMDNRNLSFGAGALRLKSRIAFSRKEDEFINVLKSNIDELNRNETGNEMNVIRYWIVASSNGGTGSGTLLDVLYLVNMVHRTNIEPGNPKVGLVLYMPRIYMNLNPGNRKYPLNAYSVMKELETFQKWSKEDTKSKLFHRLSMVGEEARFDGNMPYRPFEFCIPIDFHTDSNNNLGDIDKMYSNTAELLFYIHDGAGADGLKSFLDNYEDGEEQIAPECFLIPMGYMALRKPEEQFENYISTRIKYEVLRHGVIGESAGSSQQRRKQVIQLFDTVIKCHLFEQGATGNSYYAAMKGVVDEKIDEDLPDNAIKNDKDKIVTKLPGHITIDTARGVIDSIEATIATLGEKKEKALDAIRVSLWRWAEDNARKWGLLYVKEILQELDAYCTEIYLAYTTDTNAEILGSLGCFSRKSLTSQRDSLENGLPDLYHNALETTFPERIKRSNDDDVRIFYFGLKEWVETAARVRIHEEAFEMLGSLSYGDRGEIDKVLTHIRQLLAEASMALNGNKGAAQAYTGLAKSFYLSTMDVTSIYLPDITRYVDGFGWIEDGNLFSELYGRVIGRSGTYEPGLGYIPVRNQDNTSLESFFSQMITSFEGKMTQDRYMVDGGSRLFTNTDKSDFKRMIEDILDYAVGTMKSLIRQDEVVNSDWYRKSLADFYEGLNIEDRKKIKHRAQPPLFFPYKRPMNAGQTFQKSFYVGPEEVLGTVFGITRSDRVSLYDEDDDSVMYGIIAKIGLSFDYYDMYNSIKQAYDDSVEREYYHFHQAFAHAGSQVDGIKLPNEIRPEEIVFAKYLLLNKLCRSLSDFVKMGTEAYNKHDFAQSPLLRRGQTIRFAMDGALESDRDRVALRVADSGIDHYYTVVASRPEYRWTEFLEGFTLFYREGRFASLAGELIRRLGLVSGDLLRRKYLSALNAVKQDLNQAYLDSNEKTEKETIQMLIRTLETKLDDFEKFISSRYFS